MHAPAHIRKAFIELVGGQEVEGVVLFDNEEAQEQWDRMGAEGQIQALAGWLWYCTHIVPNYVCDDLDMLRGSTYAEAAQLVRRE